MSTIWISFSVSVSRFEMRRTCSSTSGREVLRLVDEQHDVAAFARAPASRKRWSASTWSFSEVARGRDVQVLEDRAQQLGRGERGVEHERGGGARVEAGEEVAGERRLARAHLARDEDEAAPLLAPELEVREGLGVARARGRGTSGRG